MGGTGKSFVIEALQATLRLQGSIVLTVASSGIAAIQLTGGRTFHSRFKCPIQLSPGQLFQIPKQSNLAGLIRRASLIIWDESTMMSCRHLDSLDRTLKDLTSSWRPFGGIVVLLAGDFRQCLPVVERGNRRAIVDAAICNAKRLWNDRRRHVLTENLRARTGGGDAAWVALLESIGNGAYGDGAGEDVQLPLSIVASGEPVARAMNTPILDETHLSRPRARFRPSCI